MLERYLYSFGFQAPNLVDTDSEDSRCVWIIAANESEALKWGREISERFVGERWPESPSWMAGNYAHWIETENEEALRWAAGNAPCCNIGEFPAWTER